MTTADPYTTRINDPVHGTIHLSDVERELIGTKAYQRLHNVFQLGLTHLVFPGANYSRFAHSLGTCHIAGRLLRSIQKNNSGLLNETDVQAYRLAALLHDIGHYPFSHSMEHAIGAYYPGEKFLAKSDSQKPVADLEAITDGLSPDDEPASFDHELLGKRIITRDSEILAVLDKHRIPVEDVIKVFSASRPGSLIHMVSSDLDCDRLDYLMRTAHHAGIPYGSVDIDYIISQATTDDEGNFCFRQNALKAADHLLVSRFFDYQSVPFHKTVVAIELLLEDVLTELFQINEINCSSSEMMRRINDGDWSSFDDHFMIHLFRETIKKYKESDVHKLLITKIRAILERKPPKLIWRSEKLANRESRDAKTAQKAAVDRIETRKQIWSDRTGIPVAFWRVWKNSFPLTKIGSTYSLSSGIPGDDDPERNRAVRLLDDRLSIAGATSKAIMEFEQALVTPLADQIYNTVRLYVLLDPTKTTYREDRESIQRMVEQDMADFSQRWLLLFCYESSCFLFLFCHIF